MRNFESLALKILENRIYLLDQTLLPKKEKWFECESVDHMIQAIKALQVRGAPLIGIAAAASLEKFIQVNKNPEKIQKTAQELKNARPTAVNLMSAIDRVLSRVSVDDLIEEDVNLCEKIASNGVDQIQSEEGILTHCNTGGLATAGIGTALGVIRKAHEQGKKIHVFVDETRPLLQGARLTTWELNRLGISNTLICDNMAGTLMKDGKIQKIIVGADRIALNGDFANKIGTYSLAVLAKFHQIPFFVAAPFTTVDRSLSNGAGIPIEQRDPQEVRRDWTLGNQLVFNPAFDVTPSKLVTGWILDSGYYSYEDIKGGKLQNNL